VIVTVFVFVVKEMIEFVLPYLVLRKLNKRQAYPFLTPMWRNI